MSRLGSFDVDKNYLSNIPVIIGLRGFYSIVTVNGLMSVSGVFDRITLGFKLPPAYGQGSSRISLT